MMTKVTTKMKQTLLTIISFLLAPAISIILLLFYFYRRMVDIVLRIQLKDQFAGLLDGTDSVWAIEESSSLSVINILVILEKDARHSNINFLENFRRLVKDRIVDSPFEKLRYKRRRRFGYFFWERSDHIDLEERVRWLEYERKSCDGSCDSIYNGHLRRILWNVCNQPLPECHSASWEILVGRCCPRSSYHYLRRMEERLKNGKIRIPILFRVHHSLGDGASLVKLFQDIVADKESSQETFLKLEDMSFRVQREGDFETLTITVPKVIYPERCLIEDNNFPYSCRKDILSASMPFIHFAIFSHVVKLLQHRFIGGVKFIQNLTVDEIKRAVKVFLGKEWSNLKDFLSRDVYEIMRRFLRTVIIVISAPGCLIQQAQRCKMDNSALHGAELSGEKSISYWLEDDFKNSNDQKLVTKIQTIKNITGARFEDVLLAALSVSLHKYFLRVNETAPELLNVVLPADMGKWSENDPLQNSFSVGVLPICISKINERMSLDPTEDSQILERLEDIKIAKEKLKKGSDYRMNFLVMKYLSAVLPEQLLRPILESHSTMIFSNLVGPREVRILGHHLKNIAFWIPNRSRTGIGFSLLTYRGYLHLSLVADKALVQDEKLLTEILEHTVKEIDDLYDRLTLSFFSRRLHRNTPTPTKKEIGVL